MKLLHFCLKIVERELKNNIVCLEYVLTKKCFFKWCKTMHRLGIILEDFDFWSTRLELRWITFILFFLIEIQCIYSWLSSTITNVSLNRILSIPSSRILISTYDGMLFSVFLSLSLFPIQDPFALSIYLAFLRSLSLFAFFASAIYFTFSSWLVIFGTKLNFPTQKRTRNWHALN